MTDPHLFNSFCCACRISTTSRDRMEGVATVPLRGDEWTSGAWHGHLARDHQDALRDNEKARGHGTCDIGVGGPAARVALRGRLDGRAVRPAAPGAVTAGGREPAGEAAFAALVARHGPMVLGVCRQLLGDVQHAEDTFQAVFVVLARKARSIRDPDLLGNWLYGVAIRTARCARQQIARRRRREEGGTMSGSGPGSCDLAEPTAPPADRPAIDREQAEALHGEIDRLPRAFRLPVVLCYFEGLTLDEAARRLRCPAGTLRSRLARAREKLRSAWLAGASPCRPPPWAPSWRPGPPRRPFLPSCAIPPPGPRSPSRPVTPPPAGRSPPPPRRWPRRSSVPCCSTSSSSSRCPCCSWPPSPPAPAGSPIRWR